VEIATKVGPEIPHLETHDKYTNSKTLGNLGRVIPTTNHFFQRAVYL